MTTPSTRMLRQLGALTRPGEALDGDLVPRANTEVIHAAARCAVSPLSAASAAQLRAASGAASGDSTVYLHPELPEVRVGAQLTLTSGETWTITGPPRSHYGRGGVLGHRAYLAVQELS